jgi:hypothetical protein
MVLRKPQSDTRAFRHLKHRFSAHLMVGVFFSRRDIMAEANDYLVLLQRTLHRLEKAVFDVDTPPRDLASLTRQLLEVSQEIERLESENGGANAPTATEVEDEPFDPSEV